MTIKVKSRLITHRAESIILSYPESEYRDTELSLEHKEDLGWCIRCDNLFMKTLLNIQELKIIIRHLEELNRKNKK